MKEERKRWNVGNEAVRKKRRYRERKLEFIMRERSKRIVLG